MGYRIVIDACCVINLAAADAFATWLPTLGHEWMVPRAVLAEALFLRVFDEGGEPGREAIDLAGPLAQGLIQVVEPEGAVEVSAYVGYARDLDDGEAMALSLAESRGWVLATDDRRARAMAEAAGVLLLDTPHILKDWADRHTPSPRVLGDALLRIKQRARYLPGPRDPLFDWWMGHLPSG